MQINIWLLGFLPPSLLTELALRPVDKSIFALFVIYRIFLKVSILSNTDFSVRQTNLYVMNYIGYVIFWKPSELFFFEPLECFWKNMFDF